MKNVIIISGDLAAGKSTLADNLSEKYSILSIRKDDLTELICDEVGVETREENRALSKAAVNAMIYIFNKIAIVGDDIILEANFRTSELQTIKDMADFYHYKPILLLLYGDEGILYQRFLERLPKRHRAHTSLNLDESIEKFKEYINSLREQDFVFEPITIDVSSLNEKQLLNKVSLILEEKGIKK